MFHHTILLVEQLNHHIRVGKRSKRNGERGKLLVFSYLKALLYLARRGSVDVGERQRIEFKAVFHAWFPLGLQLQPSFVQEIGSYGSQTVAPLAHPNPVTGLIPQRVALAVKVHFCRVETLQGRWQLYSHVLVGSDAVVHLHLHLQRFGAHYRFKGFSFLLRLVLCLLPFLRFLLLFFQPFGVRRFRKNLYRILFHAQLPCGVCAPILHLHAQRVLVNQRRVFNPIGYGVFLSRGHCDECALGVVEIQSAQNRKFVVASRKHQRETLGQCSFGLSEKAIGLYMCKRTQRDIVGQEVRIANTRDGIDAQRVAPKRVLPHIGFRRRYDNLAVKGHFFAFLREMVVAVYILQRINAILSGCDATYNEVSAPVGFGHAQHGLGTKRAIGKVSVQSHQYAFHWF